MIVYVVSRWEDDLEIFAHRSSAEKFLEEYFESELKLANSDWNSKYDDSAHWYGKLRSLGREEAKKVFMDAYIQEYKVR